IIHLVSNTQGEAAKARRGVLDQTIFTSIFQLSRNAQILIQVSYVYPLIDGVIFTRPDLTEVTFHTDVGFIQVVPAVAISVIIASCVEFELSLEERGVTRGDFVLMGDTQGGTVIDEVIGVLSLF